MNDDYNIEEVGLMLDDCTAQKRLHYSNRWEKTFLSTCHDMHSKHIRLSSKQLKTLDDIWEKVTENG